MFAMEKKQERGSDASAINGLHPRTEDNDKLAVPPSHKTLEDTLSQSLFNLSIADRTEVEEEIHGVRCLGVAKETPDLLQRSLALFDQELLSIKNSSHRIASLKNSIAKYEQQKLSSKSKRSGPPIEVLRNVVDFTTDEGADSIAQKKKCYVNDPNVRLRFLRCENFNAKAAAKRFVNFFDLAMEVFGDFVADRPIRLTDFLETPMGEGRSKRHQRHGKKAFANSRVQYMPFRDRSGRRVKVSVGTGNAELDIFSRIKINLLLDWIASEDVETQQKGVVVICWPAENSGANTATSSGVSSCSEGEEESEWEVSLRPRITKNIVAYHTRYYQAQPCRVVAMHWCSQDKPIYRLLNSLYYFSLDSKTQARYKVHYGEPLEVRYSLQAYGIPVDLLPLTHTMALKRQHHLQWIACRTYIEDLQGQQETEQHQNFLQQQQDQFPNRFLNMPVEDEKTLKFFESFSNSTQNGGGLPVVVECPRSSDVIIGKAKACSNNPGNAYYSSLIEATHNEHDSLIHAREKVAVTWKILLHITEEQQGRFLDWNKSLNAWVVMQDKTVIRKKIANSFKEYKRSRHAITRGAKVGQKNKFSASESDDEDGSGSEITSSGIKRRKITSCMGNSCVAEKVKDTASMFASL